MLYCTAFPPVQTFPPNSFHTCPAQHPKQKRSGDRGAQSGDSAKYLERDFFLLSYGASIELCVVMEILSFPKMFKQPSLCLSSVFMNDSLTTTATTYPQVVLAV